MCSPYPVDVVRRFWTKVAITGPDDCWLWQASANRGGYGFFGINGRNRLANRVAIELTSGQLLHHDQQALHNCPNGDNPRCVNPAHLWVGSNLDNRRDAARKGQAASGTRHGMHTHPESRAYGQRNGMYTHPETALRGEAHPRSKLTEVAVRELRALRAAGWSYRALGRHFQLSKTNARDVATRKIWGHVL